MPWVGFLPCPQASAAVASAKLPALGGAFLVCMEGQFVLKGVIRWILLCTLPSLMMTSFIDIIIISSLHLPLMAPAGQTCPLLLPRLVVGLLCVGIGDRHHGITDGKFRLVGNQQVLLMT